MRDVGGGEVVGVELLFQDLWGRVDEESGAGEAGDAPDGVRGFTGVPGRGLLEDAGGFVGGCQVGGDVVEALGGGVGCSGLVFFNAENPVSLELSVEADKHGKAALLSGGWMYRNVLNGVSELLDITGDNNHVGTFLCEQTADAAAHALGPAGDEDGLASPRVSRGIGAWETRVKAHLAIDGEVVFAGEYTHCNEGQGCDGYEREDVCPHPNGCSADLSLLTVKRPQPEGSSVRLISPQAAALKYR